MNKNSQDCHVNTERFYFFSLFTSNLSSQLLKNHSEAIPIISCHGTRQGKYNIPNRTWAWIDPSHPLAWNKRVTFVLTRGMGKCQFRWQQSLKDFSLLNHAKFGTTAIGKILLWAWSLKNSFHIHMNSILVALYPARINQELGPASRLVLFSQNH